MAEDRSAAEGARPRPAPPAPTPSGADVGWGMTGTMLSGLLVWGGVGWLVDQWLDTRVFIVIGMLLGLGTAIYLVVVKYGSPGPTPAAGSRRSTPGGRTGHLGTQKGHR